MGKSKDAFRTISEVAVWLDTQAHVLRFWESKFSQVKPVKRAGGRRYYRPADMLLLGGIKKLLHDDGMTIKGAQKLLREQGVKHVSSLSQPLEEDISEAIPGTSAASDDAVDTIEQEPPAQVLEFAPKETAPEPTDVSESDAQDMAGDLFFKDVPEPEPDPVEAAIAAAIEEETPEEDTEDLPLQDEVPAFVQRVTAEQPSSESEEITPEPEGHPIETEEVSADTPLESAATVQPATEATEASEPVREQAEKPKAAPVDAQHSLLDVLTRTKSINAENRAQARELLDKLQALSTRIAETETA